ncbi:MAG: hypothetical protein RB191_22030 [Terriglobia bacterium]|nr:hypothetical protein [Terriglobia bacterium]
MIDDDAVGYAPDHPAVLASLEAMKFGKRGWESLRDECYAWLRVEENLDPNMGSNVGERYISWKLVQGKPFYQIRLQWLSSFPRIVAPDSLEAAQTDPRLAKAIARRDEVIAQGRARGIAEPRGKAVGLYAQIEAVLMASPRGREYLVTNRRAALDNINCLIKTAKAYRREEWNPANSRSVHKLFYAQEDRLSLITREWTANAATEEIRRRTNGTVLQRAGVAGRITPVRAHMRGAELSEDFKLEVGLMVEQGMTPEQIGKVATDFAKSLVVAPSVLEAVAA